MKETKLDDGSTVHEVGPIVHEYSVKTGQDGKPLVRKFGDVDSCSGFIVGGISVKSIVSH